MKNSKKIRGIIIAVIAIVAVGYLVTNLDFQTVSEHDRKSQEMERELGLVDSDSVSESDVDMNQTASSENVPVRTEQEKENHSERDKPGKELKKKKKSKKNEKKIHSKKKFKKDSKKEKTSKYVKKTHASKKNETNQKQKNRKEEKDNKTSKTKDQNSSREQDGSKEQSSQVVPPAVTPQVEQKPTEVPEKTLDVTISITCKSLLPIKNKYPNLKNYIPDNGIILSPVTVKAKEGDSVYDVLTKMCLAKKIHFDSEYNSFYKSYYVKGIAHLYEQQAGDMSGWLYFVNGKKTNYGSSAYKVKNGDVIVWGYTLDGYEY